MARVSVLLPCRDAAPWLAQCITSLREQTFADYEVVAVDDGSSDATPRLLAAWAKQDARVRLVQQPALGISAALRRAADVAGGDILVRMDADDIAHPDRIARQVELLDTGAADVCGTLVQYFPRTGLGGGALRYERWINSLTAHDDIVRDIFVECPIAHPSLALRTAALEQAGGYLDNGWPEDYDLLLRLWRSGACFGKVPAALLLWRERLDRASRTDVRYSAGAFRSCKVHHLRRSVLVDGRAAIVWGAGPIGKAFARELIRQGTSVRGFVDLDPRKLGQEIHGAPVIRAEDALPAAGLVSLAAVGTVGAREEIRSSARSLGWVEGSTFVAVA